MMNLSPRLSAGLFLIVATAMLVPSVRGQVDCDALAFYPAGATCAGGSADGRPCYVQDTGDNFGCPGGTCVPHAGGGRATYYTAGTGACGIPVSGPGEMVTAVAEHLWDGSAVCGRCARVTGPLATVVVEITDLCPAATNPEWCAGDASHLDLSEGAFAAIADPARGVTYVEWEIVPCPVGESHVTLLNKDGINEWWYAVFALNLRQGVAELEVKDSSASASWQTAVRQPYNAFVAQASSHPFQLPLSVRLADIAGNVITGDGVITDFNDFSQFDAGDQFPECSLFSDGFEAGNMAAWSTQMPSAVQLP